METIVNNTILKFGKRVDFECSHYMHENVNYVRGTYVS